jgi:hypothetical protein
VARFALSRKRGLHEKIVARSKRNQELDLWRIAAQLIALAILAAIVFPPVRQIILSVGPIAISIGLLVVVIAVGVIAIRPRSRNPACDSTRLAVVTATQPAAAGQQSTSLTTTDLMEQIRAIDWFQFEKLVALVYRKIGYAVTRRGGANPDGGIDLVLEREGQCSAVQCKHWKTWNVGVKEVREFLGSLTDAGIKKGIFITLLGYTDEAKHLARKHGIEVVDAHGFAKMFEGTDGRFDPELLTLLQDSRKFCPRCEREMVLRRATKGLNFGGKFWGCSAFPSCRFTMPIQASNTNRFKPREPASHCR